MLFSTQQHFHTNMFSFQRRKLPETLYLCEGVLFNWYVRSKSLVSMTQSIILSINQLINQSINLLVILHCHLYFAKVRISKQPQICNWIFAHCFKSSSLKFCKCIEDVNVRIMVFNTTFILLMDEYE